MRGCGAGRVHAALGSLVEAMQVASLYREDLAVWRLMAEQGPLHGRWATRLIYRADIGKVVHCLDTYTPAVDSLALFF